MLLAIWGAVYPVPYGLCVGALMVMPLLALAVIGLSGGRLAILFWVILFLMPAGAYRAYHDVQIFSKGKTVLYAAAVGLVMAGLFAAAEKRVRSWILVAVLFPVLTFTYGVSAVLESDMLLDRSVPRRFVTKVMDRHINWGTRHKTFSVTLAPWGGRTEKVSDLVTGSLYHSLRAGSAACVQEGPGALAIPWYRIEACGE